jgi:hypothetical protein
VTWAAANLRPPRCRQHDQDASRPIVEQVRLAAVRRSASAGITSQQLALQLGFKDKGQRYLLFDAIDPVG